MDRKNDDITSEQSLYLTFGWKVKYSILVVSSFVAHMFSTGMSMSLGVYYLEFLTEFNKGPGVTSFITSLNYGTLCAAGPLASFLIPYVGCANIVILGGVISSAGIFISCFAKNIYLVTFAFGAISGLGFGLVFAATITQITCNITRYRAICNGITTSGSGIGALVNPLIAEFLIKSYTWRGALLITSAITLNICVCGFLMRLVNDMDATKSHQYDRKTTFSDDITKASSTHLYMTQKEYSFICKNPLSWCININIMLFCFGQSILFTHVAAFAYSHGFSQLVSSSFISVLGITGAIGRLLLGFLCNLSYVNVHVLYVTLNSIAGICILGYTIWTVYSSMVIMLAIAGTSLASYGPVLCEVSLYIYGTESFARGYGLMLLSMACGTLIGAPCAGQLYDFSKVYSSSFYLASASFFAGALIYGIGFMVNKKIHKRHNGSL